MLKKILDTAESCDGFILRLTLGLVFLPHGLQKTLGLFGGHGFSGTMHFFTESMGIPYVLALCVVYAESVGAICLILGLLTRIHASMLGVNMTVAALMVHVPNGFFMNWFGSQKGEGFEFHILAVGIALALLIRGGGKWSVDHCLTG